MKKYISENRRIFIRQASKIVHEWNGHLEIFGRPKSIENSRQCLLLRTDILQNRKQLLGAHVLLAVNICLICSFCFYYHLLLLFICLRVGVMSAGCRQISNSRILPTPLVFISQPRETFSIV